MSGLGCRVILGGVRRFDPPIRALPVVGSSTAMKKTRTVHHCMKANSL